MKLEVEKIEFAYASGHDVLKDLSLSYETPDVLCILGANGTGKSTLLRCICGELKVQKGAIRLEGKNIESFSARERAQKIAYIPQNHVPSFAYSVIDVVTMGRTAHMSYLATPSIDDKNRALDQLNYLGIGNLSEKRYTEISGGERQLVMIAAALVQEPLLLILDEPTAHLDFGNQYKFLLLVEKLKKTGIGVLMTTHFPDHALALQGSTAVLRDASISCRGPALDVITEEAMSNLYDIEVNVRKLGDRHICVPGPLEKEEV